MSVEQVRRMRSRSRPKTPSSPVREGTRETVLQFQYPVIRNPSVSSSFADVSVADIPSITPPRLSAAPPTRAATRKRLSTVLSTVEPTNGSNSVVPETLREASTSFEVEGKRTSKETNISARRSSQGHRQRSILTMGGSTTVEADDVDTVPGMRTPFKEATFRRSDPIRQQ